jgi:hypothetical protein
MLLLFFERKCFVMALLVFFVICYVISNWYTVKIVMLFQFGIMLKTKHNTVSVINYRMRLRTPGQRLPSQSRLMTYRIACKLERVEYKEPNVINMCASAIIEVLK